MDFFYFSIPINSLSIIMLSVILFYINKYRDDETLQARLFKHIVISNIIMLAIDTVARMDGYPGTVFEPLNRIGNFLLFFFNPLVPSVWVAFAYHFIFKTDKPNKKLWALVAIINFLNVIFTILTQWFGFYYYIDSQNIYHRGNLNFISILLPSMLLGISFAMIFKNKRLIERKHFFTFIVFSSIPVACAIIQYFIYGISLIFNGVFLSVFILFIYVQVQDIYTDYLTGVANRKSLEICLRKKILSSSSENTFSAIMLDVDNFKKVNDTYGHKTGDTILKNIAAMMRKCIGDDGLIARYGGDEFCIVLDTADPRKLDCIVDKLKKCVDCFNAENNFHFSFNLGVSMGYAIYKHGMSLDDFQNNIDSLMYSHKRNGT